MKKLMIALAVAAVAAIGNAASVNWGAGTVLEPGGATANKSVTGYLFVLTADQYSALNTAYGTATGASAGEKMANTVWNAYGDKLGDAYASGTTSKKGALTLIDDSKSYGASDTAYAAIIYTYGSGNEVDQLVIVSGYELKHSASVSAAAAYSIENNVISFIEESNFFEIVNKSGSNCCNQKNC